MKKYYILERSNNRLFLNETGFYSLSGGALFKTKGLKDDYVNKNGIIIDDTYVTFSTFDYSYDVSFKDYFKKKYKINVNTKIKVIKDDNNKLELERIPIYVNLNWKERLCLDLKFKRLLIQKKEFWMWLINIIVAIGAILAGLMVAF
jgi:hypothetical protein